MIANHESNIGKLNRYSTNRYRINYLGYVLVPHAWCDDTMVSIQIVNISNTI